MVTERRQRIVIAGGGTGGHVYPGLALASELSRRLPDRELLWIGTRGGVEERLVPAAGIPLLLLPLAGLAGRGLARGARAGLLAARATATLLVSFMRRRPAVAVGVGGFASGPALLAALLLGVPTVLLEQNAVPGRTNRMLSPFAAAVAISFTEAGARLSGATTLTGNPVREEVASIAPWAGERLATVLSFGGSRGARALNDAWIEALPRLAGSGMSFVIQTGDSDLERVRAAAATSGADARVVAYLNDMPRELARADLVVARSGATTVAELTVAGRASILIPYPHAADDHQRANANALSRAGAAIVVDPSELDASALASTLEQLAAEPVRLADMAAAARALGRPDAAARVATIVERLAGSRA